MPAASRLRLAAVPLAFLLMASAALPQAGAAGNKGSIKVLDEPGDAGGGNDPHVDCEDLWISGESMADEGGSLTFFALGRGGSKTLVLATTWSGTPDDKGHAFLAGPFSFAPDHYQVEADDGDGAAKAKTFWVDECPTGTPSPTPTSTSTSTGPPTSSSPPSTSSSSSSTAPPTSSSSSTSQAPSGLPCPTSLSASGLDFGSILLSWTPADGATGVNIYRDGVVVATLDGDATSHADTGLTPGVTYTYKVTTLDGSTETADCPTVAATAPGPPVSTGSSSESSTSPDGSSSSSSSASSSESGSSSTTSLPSTPGESPPECPSDLRAVARDDGSILLTFDPPADVDGLRIHRAASPPQLVATLPGEATSHLDTGTEVGQAYTYVVEAFRGDEASPGCPAMEVTAIPDLGSAWAMALAGAGGLAALALRRRRQA